MLSTNLNVKGTFNPANPEQVSVKSCGTCSLPESKSRAVWCQIILSVHVCVRVFMGVCVCVACTVDLVLVINYISHVLKAIQWPK